MKSLILALMIGLAIFAVPQTAVHAEAGFNCKYEKKQLKKAKKKKQGVKYARKSLKQCKKIKRAHKREQRRIDNEFPVIEEQPEVPTYEDLLPIAPEPTPEPTKEPVVYDGPIYLNCDEARANNHIPVYADSPRYGPHLDNDSDGIGCEV